MRVNVEWENIGGVKIATTFTTADYAKHGQRQRLDIRRVSGVAR